MVAGAFNLPGGVMCQTQTMFNDEKCQQVMQVAMFEKSWRDCTARFMYQGVPGAGVYAPSFM
jgi:hypothetical protein